MDLQLKDKVVLITGGAKGIGQGNVWEELAGAALALCGRPLAVAQLASA